MMRQLIIGLTIADRQHPVCRGIRSFAVRDEFYYQLKRVKRPTSITPLLQATLEGNAETIAWAWNRADGGRSFGFTGLHFHENWKLPEYRRFVAQGILWSLKLPIPEDGVKVDVPDEVLQLEKKTP
ncbi:MAG: ThuA domain-containing protein [Planctomycetes bacterium]|nr:ThuA domain-containing protein [Planctomycetota bacterium]